AGSGQNRAGGSAVETGGALFQARSSAMNAAMKATAATGQRASSRRASARTATAAAVKTTAVTTGTSAGPTPTTDAASASAPAMSTIGLAISNARCKRVAGGTVPVSQRWTR